MPRGQPLLEQFRRFVRILVNVLNYAESVLIKKVDGSSK